MRGREGLVAVAEVVPAELAYKRHCVEEYEASVAAFSRQERHVSLVAGPPGRGLTGGDAQRALVAALAATPTLNS
ncbi:hypothetical protein [Microbacterium sp. CPCC 204701]|uniref:hypothetical protein n=1 Tax=Microbacterium sp. CPCC 204701 TaxID=2493084 RepID=UPI0013E3C0B1|nr:hypothetical protein [Microbacterium sp. CPCC 204701]